MNILEIFDPDQNYDLLMTDNIISDIKFLIHNKLENHFPNLYAIWLIQRKHVYDLPWADNWTNLAYEFLKPLTRTHLLDNGEINGADYGFEPEYTANLPDELDLPDFPDEVTLKVYKEQTVSITWIERSHTYNNSLYCRQVGNYITCWHRSQKVVTAYDTDLEIKLNSAQWLINSVVIQGDGLLVNITDEQKELIMYEFLDQTLEVIYSQLQISECKVLTGCDAVLKTTVSIYEQNRFLPSGTFGGEDTNIVPIVSEVIEFGNPLFQKVPESYHFTFLQKADGTTIGKQPSIEFSGYGIFLSLTTMRSYFDQWLEEIEVNNPQGYDLRAGGAKTTVLDFSSSVNSEPDRALELRTTTDNQPELGDWNVRFSPYYSASYPALHTDYWLGQTFPNSGKLCYFFGVLDFKPVRGVEYPYSTLSDFYSFSVSKPDFNIANFRYFVDEFRIDNVNRADRRKWRQRANAVVIPFLGCRDYHLFSSGQVGMLKNSIDTKTFSTEEFTAPVPASIPQQDPNIYTRQEYLNKGKALITVNLDNISEAQISHTSSVEFTLFHESTDPPFVDTGAIWQDGHGGELPVWSRNPNNPNSEAYNQWLEPYQFYNSEQIIQSITLKREFREAPLSPFYLTTDSDGKTAKLSNAQATNLIEAISLEFDPDPDGGDIMPDSQRVIEIHAALQADKYSKDDVNPNNARVANLGWLINKISQVLGLHFQSDGAMVKVPNTKWVKPGDKIPEQYQFNQFGKNNWGNQEGVGIAYEVRSNYFGSDKFGDETIEEGGYVLCNSLLQFLDVQEDDLDRALGLQDLGANVLPKADGSGYILYQGLHSLVMELAYAVSAVSINTAQAHVLGMKSNAMLQEIMAVLGSPITLKEIDCELAGQQVKIPFSGITEGTPSMVDFFMWLLSNQALSTASQLAVKEEN